MTLHDKGIIPEDGILPLLLILFKKLINNKEVMNWLLTTSVFLSGNVIALLMFHLILDMTLNVSLISVLALNMLLLLLVAPANE